MSVLSAPSPPRSRPCGRLRVAVGAISGAIGVALLLPWSPAVAQDLPPVDLTWRAPPSCPTRDDVLARIRGRQAERGVVHESVAAVVDVARSGSSYALVLALRSGDVTAHKEVVLASCEEAADVTALLIALALSPRPERPADASETPRADEPERAEHPPTEPPSTRGRDAALSPEPSAPAPAKEPEALQARSASAAESPSGGTPLQLQGMAGVALAFDLGMLPEMPAWGARPWAALSVAWLWARASATLWLPAHADAAPLGADIEGHGIAGELALGVTLLRTRLTLTPYAALELADLTVEASRISDPGSRGALWAAAGAGLFGAYAVSGNWRVTLDASALIPFRRARFLVHTSQGDVVLLPASAAALRISAGMAYGFP